MNGKPVYTVPAKSVLNLDSGFVHKLLCDGPTFSTGFSCVYSCSFCLAADTPILMADGTTRPISDIREGDMVVGTAKGVRFRKLEATKVIKHWPTVKQGFEITLEDGREIVASADHQFFSRRGWRYVLADASAGRKGLTGKSELLGFGPTGVPWSETDAYRKGYLSGLIRGDGTIGRYRSKGRANFSWQFRLALTDTPALDRAQRFLLRFGVVCQRFNFKIATEKHRAAEAIRTSKRASYETIKKLIEWGDGPEWQRGFLAGFFDAEGTKHGYRTANTNPDLLDRFQDALELFGFRSVREFRRRPHPWKDAGIVRLIGGLSEHLRFFQAVDPAVKDKLPLAGAALKVKRLPGSNRTVRSIRPLGKKVRMFDIMTGTGDFFANGVLAHNCYVPSMMAKAPHMQEIAADHADVVVRRANALDVLRRQLSLAKGAPRFSDPNDRRVVFSSPLVDVAGNMDLVRETIEACRLILTLTHWQVRLLSKSNLLPKIAEALPEYRDRIIYGVSTGTLDNRLALAFEGGTPLVSKRLASLHWLQDNKFRTYGMICPSLPLGDDQTYARFARECSDAIRSHLCEHVWAEVINVRGESMTRTLASLVNANFIEEASLLREVSTDKEAWENYNRATFLGHAAVYDGEPGKLRFLTYVTKGTTDWWTPLVPRGAVLLGKAAMAGPRDSP